MDYLFTNLIITALILITVKKLADAPAKLHLCLLLLALISWFIPWHLIEIFVEQMPLYFFEELSAENNISKNASAGVTTSVQSAVLSTTSLWTDLKVAVFTTLRKFDLPLMIMGLSIIGLFWFLVDIYYYQRYIKALKNNSSCGNYLLTQQQFSSKTNLARTVTVRIIDNAGPGMTTGVISPVIWINKNFIDSQQLHTILLHELTHIRHFDPAIKWLAMFTKRIFFWNPLIPLIVKQIQLVIELNCDQQCYKEKQEQYSVDLAEIILKQNKNNIRSYSLSYFATIDDQKNINITRLKSLNRVKKMKFKYLVLVMSSICLSTLAVAQLNSTATNFNFEKYHEFATSIKSRDRAPMPVFVNNNEIYNEQMKQLLALSQDALTNDINQLDQIFHDIVAWDKQRETLNYNELEMQMKILSIEHFLLQMQGKNHDIIALILNHFGSVDKVSQFYRHHLTNAYLKLQQYDKAAEVITGFNLTNKRTKIGTFNTVTKALLANYQYDEALTIINNRLAQNYENETKMLLNYKHAILLRMGNTTEAENIALLLKENYQQTKIINQFSTKRISMALAWSPILDHI